MSEAHMTFRHIKAMLAAMLFTAGLCATAGEPDGKVNSDRAFDRIPSMFLPQLDALGNRVKAKGKETTIYEGQLFDAAGNSFPARVIHQLPGLVRLEGFKGQGAVLSFDGQRINGITSQKSDEDLVETFVMDLPEGMLASVQGGAAVRLIGRGFGPDPRVVPNYKGIRYDIYEVTGPVVCRRDQLIRSKLYYFDSRTGLLQSTRYYDRSISPPLKIETRFSIWGTIDGSAYPARIDHYENGKLVFSFIAESIKGEASIDIANFE
jgi:hypothetical protein